VAGVDPLQLPGCDIQAHQLRGDELLGPELLLDDRGHAAALPPCHPSSLPASPRTEGKPTVQRHGQESWRRSFQVLTSD
jgi:hypothetical protein